jgi:hypothetical protein
MKVDETIAGRIVEMAEGFDAAQRGAILAAITALLRYMKGERWSPPLPPPAWRPPDWSSHPPLPTFPGEKILTSPPIPLPDWF